jgi:hypothetical protein
MQGNDIMSEYGFSEGILIGLAKKAQPGEKRDMVFDWEKAARLINERKPDEAEAGLAGDWSYTGGLIWRDGAPVSRDESYTFLQSFWAAPQIEMDGERIDCWRYADDGCGWDSDTFWPAEAKALLE